MGLALGPAGCETWLKFLGAHWHAGLSPQDGSCCGGVPVLVETAHWVRQGRSHVEGAGLDGQLRQVGSLGELWGGAQDIS